MIVNERVVSYLHSLEKGNGDFCDEIEKYAHKTDVPIIRKEMESFLRVMIQMKSPKRILELGTAIGYSAILMAQIMPLDCKITTIENYDKRIPIAKDNFEKTGFKDRIQLIHGDALEVLKGMDDCFDFVFMDAAKGQYLCYLEEVLRLMPKGAILIADNVLQDGELIESKYVIDRRNRTIHSRMREYIYKIKNMKELETTIVPIGDGITLSVKIV